jgi:hypothetical protein
MFDNHGWNIMFLCPHKSISIGVIADYDINHPVKETLLDIVYDCLEIRSAP